MTIALSIALLSLAAWAWWREKMWRSSLEKVTRSAGLKTFEADKLAARFDGLQEASHALI